MHEKLQWEALPVYETKKTLWAHTFPKGFGSPENSGRTFPFVFPLLHPEDCETERFVKGRLPRGQHNTHKRAKSTGIINARTYSFPRKTEHFHRDLRPYRAPSRSCSSHHAPASGRDAAESLRGGGGAPPPTPPACAPSILHT